MAINIEKSLRNNDNYLISSPFTITNILPIELPQFVPVSPQGLSVSCIAAQKNLIFKNSERHTAAQIKQIGLYNTGLIPKEHVHLTCCQWQTLDGITFNCSSIATEDCKSPTVFVIWFSQQETSREFRQEQSGKESLPCCRSKGELKQNCDTTLGL